ncbi:MAG: F0F1 ATP synthase subunit epsilon [Rhodobacteraceae bacterium]|nr:F0F1 ATP synthase subunit epsilon [Paracoccaceae bacterium]
MADTMQFDLVTPERKLASAQVREVRIPGAEGDLTAMPDHAPMITTLRPGVLSVIAADGSATDYAVLGGFAEISASGVSVLAERAHPGKEMTRPMLDAMLAEARSARENAHPDLVDAAAKLLADMEALGTHMSLGGN